LPAALKLGEEPRRRGQDQREREQDNPASTIWPSGNEAMHVISLHASFHPSIGSIG
jgi:hypothetical protein